MSFPKYHHSETLTAEFPRSIFIFIWKIFFPVPEPISGIYSQPGKRGILKQIFMYILLQLRKYKSEGKPSDGAGLGVKSAKNIKELESVKVNHLIEMNVGL